MLQGPNGAGKTNFLEAVAVLATLKGLRRARWGELPRWGAARARVAGQVRSHLGRRELSVVVEPGGRFPRLDGSPAPVERYLRVVGAVVFTPADTAIVRGPPELRRRYLDRAVFNRDAAHLERVRDFRRVLAQRAALLRSGRATPAELGAWDRILAPLGARLVLARQRVARALSGPLDETYRRLTGGGASLRYRSELGEGELHELEARYLELLEASRDEELRRGRNLVGPQRDELEISFQPAGGARLAPARSYGSQGQVRALALALKLAQLRVAGAEDPPLLLLDDLSSELDAARMGALVELLGELEAQVLASTTDASPLLRGLREPVHLLDLEAGALAGGGGLG